MKTLITTLLALACVSCMQEVSPCTPCEIARSVSPGDEVSLPPTQGPTEGSPIQCPQGVIYFVPRPNGMSDSLIKVIDISMPGPSNYELWHYVNHSLDLTK